MGELYERLLDQHPTKAKIYTDGLQACMRHFRAGRMTIDQIDAYFASQMGQPLGTAATGSEAGRTEAQDLLATIPQVTQAPGGTQAQQTTRLNQQMAQIIKLADIESILVMADTQTAPFNTPAALRTALGVPDRS
jgi:hypothetical protein